MVVQRLMTTGFCMFCRVDSLNIPVYGAVVLMLTHEARSLG